MKTENILRFLTAYAKKEYFEKSHGKIKKFVEECIGVFVYSLIIVLLNIE